MKTPQIINKEIDGYKDTSQIKEHELKLLEIIENENKIHNQHVLDVGCASGNFLALLRKKYKYIHLYGFDISSTLIEIAKKRKIQNCELTISSIQDFNSTKKYDIIIASGVMSLFDDFSEPLDNWLSHLNPNGKIYVFGRFNSHDIDTIIHHRNNYHDKPKWTGGLTSYSINTVSKYLERKSVNYKFYKFFLNTNLLKSDNPIKTFSIISENPDKIIMNGANIIAEQYFLSINKK